MLIRKLFMLCCLSVFGLTACSEKPRSTAGFVMPPGDAGRGQQVFVKYQCYECHAIPDVDLPERASDPAMVLNIGVRMHRVKNYGELLTAIAYPDHAVSPKFVGAARAQGVEEDLPVMPHFTSQMTVAEFADLAEFLHQQYRRLMPAYKASHSDEDPRIWRK